MYRTDGESIEEIGVTGIADGTDSEPDFPIGVHFVDRGGSLYYFAPPDEAQTHSPVRLNLPGDADENGVVDDIDLALLMENLDGPGGWNKGDFNLDGRVGEADLRIFFENEGLDLINTPIRRVPEPCSLFMSLVAIVTIQYGWRRKPCSLDRLKKVHRFHMQTQR